MSLRAIHIVFISLATVLLIGLGLWSWSNYAHGHAGRHLFYLIFSALSVIGLVVYLIKFIQKTRSL